MFASLKRRLYFVAASYFAFWARLVLRRWRPKVVVVTGSSGKTTLLHLIEAQLGDKAKYSHHANSSFGLPFDILGLPQVSGSRSQWLKLFLLAPLKTFRRLPVTRLYIAEADCDRPHEGKFLAKLLKPSITLWVSVFRTHSMNFDKLVKNGQFDSHEAAIAYEFGYFAEAASELVGLNDDNLYMTDQLDRVGAQTKVFTASQKDLKKHGFENGHTVFQFADQTIRLAGLHPKELAINLELANKLLETLGLPLDADYQNFEAPPGRSSVFKGIKSTTIIDSTYNTGLGAMKAIIELFADYPARQKWLVLGDILEQGNVEAEEHVKLAEVISTQNVDRIILLGPRVKKYSFAKVKQAQPNMPVDVFEGPKEVLDFIQSHLNGGETILFKGARGLEGVIEQLLANPADAKKLVRREKSWVKIRQKWGLPS